MMDAPVRAAEQLRRSYGIAGVATEKQIDGLLEAVGLRVRLYPFASELTGVLYRSTVYLRPGLDAQTRKVIKAHEIGHRMLGHGNMLFTPLTSGQMSVYGNRDERDAMIFTGALLFGDLFDGHLDERLREASESGMSQDHIFPIFNAVTSAVRDAGQAKRC